MPANTSPELNRPSGLNKNYVHSQKQCSRCHIDKKDLQTVLTISLGKCQGCHESDNPLVRSPSKARGMLRKVSTRQDEIKLKVSLVHGKVNQKDTLGMRFPLYSKESRLGDVPNQMILIPSGKFIMGTDTRLPDEGPQHAVTLPAYYIDEYEVTNLQYKKFNDVTNGRSPRHWRNRTFPEGKATPVSGC